MKKLLLSRVLPKLSKKEWYNQRFDGSPLFLYFMGFADSKPDKRIPRGANGKVGVCFFNEGKADWYFALDDIKSGAEHIIAAAKKDPQLSKKLLKRWKKDELAFENFFWHAFPKIKLGKLSNKELFELLNKIFKLFVKATSSTSIIDRFALGTDEYISTQLRKEIFLKKENYKESEFTEIFSSLTAPVHQSFINEAEIDLLKITAKISSQSLEDYQSKYFWIHNNYVSAKTLNVGFFKKQIDTNKKTKKAIEKQIVQIQQTPLQSKVKKQKLLSELNLSSLLKTLLTISEDFTWWQDQRKKFTYFNIHMGNQVLKEIARRTDYTITELKYTLLHELETILKISKPSRTILKKRIKNSSFIITPTGSLISEGKETNTLKKALQISKDHSGVQDFRGLSASTGRAIGKARIIKSVQDIKKMQQDEILVAVMTRPDYIPAMKKAIAIVTNEGGVTSHAAIVSRELNIPCIIGTKIATEVLKTGDVVEVNANHGWVKKLAQ